MSTPGMIAATLVAFLTPLAAGQTPAPGSC
jgi:hypothetical protein